jgi:hypothetical protein
VSGAPVTRRYVMACTEGDFHRLLAPALGPYCYDAARRCFAATTSEPSWRLSLTDAGERRIGLLRLPLTQVTFSVTGYTEPEVEALLRRFFAYFQRGGG